MSSIAEIIDVVGCCVLGAFAAGFSCFIWAMMHAGK